MTPLRIVRVSYLFGCFFILFALAEAVGLAPVPVAQKWTFSDGGEVALGTDGTVYIASANYDEYHRSGPSPEEG